MMDSWSDYHLRQTIQPYTKLLQEQLLYSHLLDCVQGELPEQTIERFRQLFIHGAGYSSHEVWQALKRIVDSAHIEKDFKFILNRCCYILISHWLTYCQDHSAIQTLIGLFEGMPVGHTRSRTTLRIRQLVQDFKLTEQYAALKRLAQVLSPIADPDAVAPKPLGALIRRYPYLYEASLLTKDSSDEQRRQIRQMRHQMQHQFERNLACYATHRQLGSDLSFYDKPFEAMRREAARQSSIRSAGFAGSLRNPTLLTDYQIDWALLHFGSKIDGSNTYRDLARRFLTYTSYTPSYQSFKNDLYAYLVESIDPGYGNRHLKPRLYSFLEEMLYEHDADPLTDILLVQTCRRLLQLLVVDSPQQLNHALFVDLVSNLGITATIGLLLKIVLICPRVKPFLEGLLAVLFRHYESHSSETVNWLIQVLEHFNIALSINFGTLKLYQGPSSPVF